MSFLDLTDAYGKFIEAYGDPECCGKVHWSPKKLELWLRNQPVWDGDWENLIPELLIKAASVSYDDTCAQP